MLRNDTDVAAMVALVAHRWAPTLRSWRFGGETLAAAGLATALAACSKLEVLDMTRAWSVNPLTLFHAVESAATRVSVGGGVVPSLAAFPQLCHTLTG
jgi:hypothetical protein